jgi:ABC-type dipeptide/oligopeptide/nickel transport system permease component
MLAFVIRRIAQSLIVMLFVALVAFFMFTHIGDPIHQMVGIETSFEEREKLRESLGLNDPQVVQFARFVGKAARASSACPTSTSGRSPGCSRSGCPPPSSCPLWRPCFHW